MEELSQTVWPWRRCKAVGGEGWLTHWINLWITRLFVEQPLALSGSAKYPGASQPRGSSAFVIFELTAQEHMCRQPKNSFEFNTVFVWCTWHYCDATSKRTAGHSLLLTPLSKGGGHLILELFRVLIHQCNNTRDARNAILNKKTKTISAIFLAYNYSISFCLLW